MNKALDIFSTIEEDASLLLDKLKLTLEQLRAKRGTKTITHKKAILYVFLRSKYGYTYNEIADYCYKDHTNIVKMCSSHAYLLDKYKHIL